MNRSQPSKFNGKSAISVVFVFALAAPLAAEDLDPRQRTGSQASDPAVQIADSPALLQEQVGSVAAATVQIRLTPVASHPGGAYNTGGYYTNANISGQRLTVGLGGGRTYWNAQLSNWAPATLKGYQATIGDVALLGTSADCGGGAGSCPGAGDLTYALQPCTTSANCTNAFGEAGVFGIVGGGNDGSVCRDGFCHSIFVNTTRSDWTHASVSEAFGGYGVFSFGRAVYSLSTNLQTVTDTGLDYYGGTLVIDVPAGARGVYTINWVAAETFIINGSDIVIPLVAMIPGELRVCLCNADVNNDGSVTTIDEAIVLDCIHGNCSGCVNGCDVNCDGAVDWIDMGVVRCTLQGLSDCCSRPAGACTGMQVGSSYEVCQMTLPGTCSRYLGTYHGDNTTCGGVCICNADVSGNAAVQVTDAACVADCAEGRTCACCVNGCDVDCDGTVDWADFGAVWCEFEGGSGCCDLPIGACDISQPGWPGCAETSQNACESNGGAYRGNGTTCAAPCGRAGDPPCPAGKFCEYSIGTCGSAPDGGQCTLIPAGCEPSTSPFCGCDGVTYANPCAARAAAVSVAQAGACACEARRVLTDATYCPGRVNVVRIVLTLPVEAFAVAVEDSLPAGWVVGTINNGGGYDAVNHKVKWFLPSPPFPAEVSYELTPDNAASGRRCLSGIVSIDGTSGAICGDDCLDYQCCSYMAGETPQDVCAWCAAGNCSACTTGACEDGTVSLCEVIAYGCAWVRGCNDDISGVTRAAYIWRNGECYCWDGVVQNFVPRECGSGGPCCTVGDTASVSQEFSPSLGSALASVGSARLQRGLREWDVSIDVVPMLGTSASAAELVLPKGWKVVAIGEDGAFDSANGKIKWGPYFGDTARVLTATVRPGGKRSDAKAGRLSGTLEAQAMNAMARGLYGTVSFDGVNVPINIER